MGGTTYLKGGLLLLGSDIELQCDVAMLCLPGVRVDDEGLLLSTVGDRAKRVEQSAHEVVTLVDCLLSNKSADRELTRAHQQLSNSINNITLAYLKPTNLACIYHNYSP